MYRRLKVHLHASVKCQTAEAATNQLSNIGSDIISKSHWTQQALSSRAAINQQDDIVYVTVNIASLIDYYSAA